MPTVNLLGRDVQKKKKSTTSKKPAKLAAPLPSYKSSEYVQDSDEEPENHENKTHSDSDEESFPSNPADIPTKINGKLPRPAGSSSSSENESESDESGSEADDEEEGEETPPTVVKKTAARPSEKFTESSKWSVVTFQKPPQYKAPVGFEKVSVDGTPKAGHMFKKSSLEGKQIWYFTAPASLPISSIGRISLKDATDSKPVVNHKDTEYGFVRDSAEDKTYTKIMVPNGSDDGYRTAKRSINQIFHLQQIVKLPGIHASNSITAGSSRATVPAQKPIRQQPRGLKMRFRPIGFGDGETGKIGSSASSNDGSTGSDTDESPAATFRQPITMASDSSEGDASSEDSESDKESSISDAEIAEESPLPIQPATKEKEEKASSAVPSSQEVTKASLKRKHGGKEDRKPKHSLSRSPSIDDRTLKRLKKDQTKPQRSLGEKASVLSEPRHGSLKHSPKSEVNSSQNTPIRPPKSTILPHSSPSRPKASPNKHDRESLEIVKSKKRDCSEISTPFQQSGISLQDLTKATDPSLTGDERRKKIKKLKNKE